MLLLNKLSFPLRLISQRGEVVNDVIGQIMLIDLGQNDVMVSRLLVIVIGKNEI